MGRREAEYKTTVSIGKQDGAEIVSVGKGIRLYVLDILLRVATRPSQSRRDAAVKMGTKPP